jgi:hypothetical protein
VQPVTLAAPYSSSLEAQKYPVSISQGFSPTFNIESDGFLKLIPLIAILLLRARPIALAACQAPDVLFLSPLLSSVSHAYCPRVGCIPRTVVTECCQRAFGRASTTSTTTHPFLVTAAARYKYTCFLTRYGFVNGFQGNRREESRRRVS